MSTQTRKANKSTNTLRKGTAVTTPGGYTAKVVGPDPKDSDRVIIRYTGNQAYLGEDSYTPSQLRVVGAPPEIQEKPARAKRRSKTAAEPLTIYKPASDTETIEQGLKEGWIQPAGEVKAEQSCDRCQFQEIEHNCSEGKAFKCTQGKITGAIFVGGIIAQELAKTCDAFQATVEPELPWKFIPNWLEQEDADFWLEYSQSQVEWRHNNINMFGRDIQLPRLEAIIGDGDYSYSGVTLKAQPWGKEGLYFIKQRIEKATGFSYSIGIGNQYRDGNDHIGWHSDDSKEMGKSPAIASLSLGATRKFQLRHKQTKQVHTFELTHGSLFVMLPGCQEQYHHRICKASGAGLRINWTFRPLAIHEQRPTPKNPGNRATTAQPNHPGNRNSSQHSSGDGKKAPLPAVRSGKNQARRHKTAAPLDSNSNRPIAQPLPPSTPDGRPWITGDWVEGTDDNGTLVQGTVAAEGVGYLRLTTNVAIYQPKLIHPASSIEAKRQHLINEIEAVRKSGEVMPTGCWIEAYHVTRRLKTGDKQQYKYFRVKAYQPMFEDDNGTLKRSKNLGDVSSKAYQDWCQRRHRREQINQLQKQLSKLDRECNNKSPPEKFVVYHVPQAWFEGNNVHWGAIPDDYEPIPNTYREYRRKGT